MGAETPCDWATTPVCPYIFTLTQRADLVLLEIFEQFVDAFDGLEGGADAEDGAFFIVACFEDVGLGVDGVE